MSGARVPLAAAIATGVLLELGVGLATGRREAWDSGVYWTIGMPAAALIALVLGATYPRKSWRWGLCILPAQVTAMMLRSGEIGNLWPLMLVLAAILGAPLSLASALGGFVGRRMSPERQALP